MKARTGRSFAVIASSSLVLGALFAGPAQAKRKPKKPPIGCPAATYAEPASASESRTEVPGTKALTVTDAATADAPLTVEYEHGLAQWETTYLGQPPIQEDTKWFNLQIDSASRITGLYVRLDWATPSASDIDLLLWDAASGEQAASSQSLNLEPVAIPTMSSTGGMGWESIRGHATGECAGYTVESRAFNTFGEHMTVSVWLGKPIV